MLVEADSGIVLRINHHREHGGLGLPNDLTETRAIALQSLIEGLAIRAVREPDLDPETLRAALAQVIPQLLSP